MAVLERRVEQFVEFSLGVDFRFELLKFGRELNSNEIPTLLPFLLIWRRLRFHHVSLHSVVNIRKSFRNKSIYELFPWGGGLPDVLLRRME